MQRRDTESTLNGSGWKRRTRKEKLPKMTMMILQKICRIQTMTEERKKSNTSTSSAAQDAERATLPRKAHASSPHVRHYNPTLTPHGRTHHPTSFEVIRYKPLLGNPMQLFPIKSRLWRGNVIDRSRRPRRSILMRRRRLERRGRDFS